MMLAQVIGACGQHGIETVFASASLKAFPVLDGNDHLLISRIPLLAHTPCARVTIPMPLGDDDYVTPANVCGGGGSVHRGLQ